MINKFKALSLPKKIGVVLIIFILFGCCSTVSQISKDSKSSDPTSQANEMEDQVSAIMTNAEITLQAFASATPEPSPTTPLAPMDQFKADLVTKLGNGNRDIPRLTESHIENTTLYVTIAADDNIFEDSIIVGMLNDIVNTMKLAKNLEDWDLLTVVVTFPLVDNYGNTKEGNVIIADYTRETVNKIQFDTFFKDKTLVIANQESLFIHPAIAEMYIKFLSK